MKDHFRDSLRLNVEIISINVSAFTQDILLWNGEQESSFKLVMPSHTRILGDTVNRLTEEKKDIVVSGVTMGGGPFNKSLKQHIEVGLNVFMSKDSAKTIRDNLEHVKEKGIIVVEDEEIKEISQRSNTILLETKDVDLEALAQVYSSYGLTNKPKAIAIGVEDHGTATGELTDREIRFEYFKSLLPSKIEGFGFSNPPDRFTRMTGVKKTLTESFPDVHHLVMDSKIAAVFGAAAQFKNDKVIVVDGGYGHTIVASLDNYELTGIFEHHTRMLNNDKIMDFIKRFRVGDLTNKDIFEDDGHGCSIARPIGGEAKIIVSGPLGATLFNDNEPGIEFANPHKDSTIRGNIGLIECTRSSYNIE